MSIRVPVRYRFDASVQSVQKAYQKKMHERMLITRGLRVSAMQNISENEIKYRVVRPMPAWYRVLGGPSETEYEETLRIHPDRIVTSASQNLPFGGEAETKITFMEDGDKTRVFGVVTVRKLPPVVENVAKRVFKLFVEKAFQKERDVETKLI